MAKNLITTPKGRAVYPHLNSPDTKFDETGTYHTKVAIPLAEAKPLIEKLEKLAAESLEEAKKENPKEKKIKEADLPFQVDEEKGEVVIGFKMKAQITSKKTNEVINLKPALFDAKGKPLPKGVKVGGGSTLRVSFEPSKFYTKLIGAGISLRLQAVQVIDLVEFGGGSASSYGFEEEEGFTAEDAANDNTEKAANDNAETEDAASGSDGSDF